jgi:hypothetical protein
VEELQHLHNKWHVLTLLMLTPAAGGHIQKNAGQPDAHHLVTLCAMSQDGV